MGASMTNGRAPLTLLGEPEAKLKPSMTNNRCISRGTPPQLGFSGTSCALAPSTCENDMNTGKGKGRAGAEV